MLDYILQQTEIFLQMRTKEERKIIGQFFTSKDTAVFMSSLFQCAGSDITVLDTGAGSGILTAAFIEKMDSLMHVQNVHVVLYENNAEILPILYSNMEYICQHARVNVQYEIKEENFILTNSKNFLEKGKENFDYIIGNPPYKKIPKKASEALAMPNVCYGAPNLYFLFAAMSLHLLKPQGQMVYIIPRSWTSGAYFEKFRYYFLTHSRLTNIHLFVSRDKVFSSEDVLQETMIIKAVKTQYLQRNVDISSSKSNSDFGNITHLIVPYDTVVSPSNGYFVYLPISEEDIQVLSIVKGFQNTLLDLGMKLKTGLTVGFRNREMLRAQMEESAIPIIKSPHFIKGLIEFPNKGVENQYLVTDKQGMIQQNKNYLFLKRFTAKEEKRRLQPAIYLKEFLPQYLQISSDNKINFIERLDRGELSAEVVGGLYVVFNSTLFDKYYRILNGSTQVNATEINAIKIPSLEELEFLGTILLRGQDLSTDTCDRILTRLLEEQLSVLNTMEWQMQMA